MVCLKLLNILVPERRQSLTTYKYSWHLHGNGVDNGRPQDFKWYNKLQSSPSQIQVLEPYLYISMPRIPDMTQAVIRQ
jgi:hypothetical protein